MKMKSGYSLHDLAGQTVVIPEAGGLDMDVMITMNETGKFLWEHMQQETTVDALVSAILAEYDTDAATAKAAVEAFVQKLKGYDLLDG